MAMSWFSSSIKTITNEIERRKTLADTAAVSEIELEQPVPILEQVSKVVPPTKPKIPTLSKIKSNSSMKEYAEIAKKLNLTKSYSIIEEFQAFLTDEDWPIFNLKEVIAYMNEKSKQEGTGGWVWKPLRQQDFKHTSFGKRGFWQQTSSGVSGYEPASDYYSYGDNSIYTKIVPLNTLKKALRIHEIFKDEVALMISDYAPKPEYAVDPFMMAVIPNDQIRDGVGRYVIDMWDEPGFGLDKQLI